MVEQVLLLAAEARAMSDINQKLAKLDDNTAQGQREMRKLVRDDGRFWSEGEKQRATLQDYRQIALFCADKAEEVAGISTSAQVYAQLSTTYAILSQKPS